jgi:hypothetical protein
MDKVSICHSNPSLVAALVSQALVLVPELCKGTTQSKGLPGRKLDLDEPLVYRNIALHNNDHSFPNSYRVRGYC